VFVTAMMASSTAIAQSAVEPVSGAEAISIVPAAGEWRSYPNERHVLTRLQGGIGLRLFDPYSAGVLAPGWIHAQGGFLFINAGKLRMGPTLGAQLGLDLWHSGLQGAVQPGWTLMYRSATRWAIMGRVDVPFVLTRSWDPARDACIYLPGAAPRPGMPDTRSAQVQDPCMPSNMLPARVPYGVVPAVAVGVEAGGSFAYFLTGGFALTAELSAGIYFGDSGVSIPVLGLGLGTMFDFELLP
jgi:hypothetical protein